VQLGGVVPNTMDDEYLALKNRYVGVHSSLIGRGHGTSASPTDLRYPLFLVAAQRTNMPAFTSSSTQSRTH
jgi:hypothetical protein